MVSLRFASSYKREFIREFIQQSYWSRQPVHSFVSHKREVIRKSVVVQVSHKRIQKLSVQLWSVNQRTTEAEEVTDS
jgi:hypothetical protein